MPCTMRYLYPAALPTAAGRAIQSLEYEETIMKTLFTLLMSSAFIVLPGCNTVVGVGKDIERGGEKVQDIARDVQRKL